MIREDSNLRLLSETLVPVLCNRPESNLSMSFYTGYCSVYTYITDGTVQSGKYRVRGTGSCPSSYVESCHATKGCFCSKTKDSCSSWKFNKHYKTAIVPTVGHCICVPFPAPFVPNKVAHVDVRFTRTGSLYFRHGLATKQQVRHVLSKSCAGRNELSKNGALGYVTADSFESPANCIALCTSAETCVSFELRHRDNRCSFSTSCTESVAIANSGDHDLYVMIREDPKLRFELKNTMVSNSII